MWSQEWFMLKVNRSHNNFFYLVVKAQGVIFLFWLKEKGF